MFALVIFVTICFAGNTAMATSLNDKPFYNLDDSDNLFKDYVKQYGKIYDRKEYSERLEIFKGNLKDINRRNAKYPTTTFAVNRFADLTPEELQQYRGLRLNDTGVKVKIPDSPEPAPKELDWRQKGVVTHVKDQGPCGSCYIFSAIGNIEGQYAIKHNQCLALSEGQALDCLLVGSCGGGEMYEVMQEFALRAGVMKEEDYRYIPYAGDCKEDENKVVAHLINGIELDIPDEDTLLKKLVEIGPLSVALSADDFVYYHGGILRPESCVGNVDDHAVLLVGYGEENGEKFWIIKNSWGRDWGEDGYVRMRRGVKACNIGLRYTATAIVA